jgi:Phage terminase, small subunit
MARKHDMPDMRTLDDVSPAPEEPLPPPWVSDGAAMAPDWAALPPDGAAMAPDEPSATSPPLGLSGAAAAWWRATVEEFELEPHQIRTLSEAAFAWDRCQQARALVNHQGLVVQDASGELRAHPAVAIEHDSRIAYLRAMHQLDLDAAPLATRRPRST